MGSVNHLRKWEDLVTSYQATRAGFISIAFEKSVKATPFVEEAKSLKSLLNHIKKPKQLLEMKEIYPSLLTAAGLSDKSLNHFNGDDKKEAIRNLIEKFLEPAGDDFIDELVYRFLLTRGDTLGGMMRNIAGAIAFKKLIRSIISALSVKHKEFRYLHSTSNNWLKDSNTNITIEENARGLYWENSNGHRVLAFNITPPIVKKNVDICLFDCKYDEYNNEIVKTGAKYLALGELKGGIDPAGADEHWKTANTALIRIRTSFAKIKKKPLTFFIGAAIEKSMAQEIYNQLKKKVLSNAANLMNDIQLNSICHWICEI